EELLQKHVMDEQKIQGVKHQENLKDLLNSKGGLKTDVTTYCTNIEMTLLRSYDVSYDPKIVAEVTTTGINYQHTQLTEGKFGLSMVDMNRKHSAIDDLIGNSPVASLIGIKFYVE
ncbi:hypothetical protein HAX54_010748, partial [Datura stramonium]|nr:hypothetical protein [Datura stramonium]